jgi:hypothetical protein
MPSSTPLIPCRCPHDCLHHRWVHAATSPTASTMSSRPGTMPPTWSSLPHRCTAKPTPPPPLTEGFFSSPTPPSSGPRHHLPDHLQHRWIHDTAYLTTSTNAKFMLSPLRLPPPLLDPRCCLPDCLHAIVTPRNHVIHPAITAASVYGEASTTATTDRWLPLCSYSSVIESTMVPPSPPPPSLGPLRRLPNHLHHRQVHSTASTTIGLQQLAALT